jgi:photosystem II stability/assembly factor-like uncharacterized protein
MRTVTRGLIALSAAVGIYVFTLSPIGDVTERWEANNTAFKIRIDQRAEDLWFFGLPGAYYVFQSSRDGARWHEIMTFRHDDPVPIPRENVRFLNERTAFVFMAWMYAVTTDGGNTWSNWTAKDDLPGWRCCDYALIKNVDLSATGLGTMTITARGGGEYSGGEQLPFGILVTNDFGRHWSSPPG